MCPHTEAFLDQRATVGAFLTGIVRRHGDDFDSMQKAVSGKPLEKDPPASIMNALCQFAVADHIANLKVLLFICKNNGYSRVRVTCLRRAISGVGEVECGRSDAMG